MSDDKNKKHGVFLLPYATYCIKHKMGIGSPKKSHLILRFSPS